MPDIIKPEISELSYRRKLLRSEKTMAFNHGTIPFEKDEWAAWHHQWVEADPKDKYFRMFYCSGCEDFTAMAGYEKTGDHYEFTLITQYDMRGVGYGSFALQALAQAAEEVGIDMLYARVYMDNPYLEFFCKRGFECVECYGEQMLIAATTESLASGKVYDDPCRMLEVSAGKVREQSV